MSRMQSPVRLLAVAIGSGSMLVGGCSTLSGVGGQPRYACQAPTGAQCTSVSGVYASTGRPSAGPNGAPPAVLTGTSALMDRTVIPHQQVTSAAPASRTDSLTLRSPPRLLSLWIAPWEDSDGDLNEASTVHMVVDVGRWQIDRVKPARTDPVFAMPPARSGTTPPGSSAPPAPRAADTLTPIPLTEP